MSEDARPTRPDSLGGRLYTPEELAFMLAIDAYKRHNRRPFPAWSEVLAVARALGYRKVADPGPMPRYGRKEEEEEP